MSWLIPLWEALKDPLLKGLNQAKDNLNATLEDLQEASSLLESTEPSLQKEGLELLKLHLENLVSGDEWKLISKNGGRHLVQLKKLIDTLIASSTELLENFDDEGRRKRKLAIISQRLGRLILQIPKSGNKKFYSTIIYRSLLLVIPGLLLYWVTEFLKKENRLISESYEVLAPLNTYDYSSLGNSFTTKRAYKKEFWKNFNEEYWKKLELTIHEDGTVSWLSYPNQDSERSSHQLKLVMRNRSGNFPLMVSTLQIGVEYEEQPFDWEKIDTDAHLRMKFDNSRWLRLKRSGAAPVFDIVGRSVIEGLAETEKAIDYPFLKEDISIDLFKDLSFFRVDAKGQFIDHDTLYALARTVKSVAGFDTIRNDDGVFLRLSSIDDLKKLVVGNEAEHLELSLGYQTLKGEAYQLDTSLSLDTKYFLFPDSSIILDEPIIPNEPNAVLAEAIFTAADDLVQIMGKEPELDPEGTMMFVGNLSIDLEGIEDGGSRYEMLNVDQVINPSGFVTIYLSLDNILNGDYTIKLMCNGDAVDEVRLETLVPPEKHFHYPQSLKYFRTDSL